jgi:hypothetical protein
MNSSQSEEPGGAALTRRQFVTGLGAFFSAQLLLPRVLHGAVLDRALKPLRLGFMTDCHAMYENDAPAYLVRAADLMNALNPDLIIGGGGFCTWRLCFPREGNGIALGSCRKLPEKNPWKT